MFIIGDMQPEAINYWLVCIPVVILGAPLGSLVVNKIERTTIAYLLYSVILAQFTGAFFIIQPSGVLLTASAFVFFIGISLFFLLTRRYVKPIV